jgi:hypothetical protein
MADGSDKPESDTATALRFITAVNDIKSLRRRMVGTAAKIIDEMERLALFAESEQVRLGACRDWLDRAGIRGDANEPDADDAPATPEEEAAVIEKVLKHYEQRAKK